MCRSFADIYTRARSSIWNIVFISKKLVNFFNPSQFNEFYYIPLRRGIMGYNRSLVIFDYSIANISP